MYDYLNPYYPNNTQTPLTGYQPMRYPTYQPQPQAQMVQQQTQGGINWVQGEAGAKAAQVQPGTPTILMDSELEYFYIKHIDPATGLPSLKKYRYEEVQEEAPKADYITREEFEKFISDMDKPKRTAKKETEEDA